MPTLVVPNTFLLARYRFTITGARTIVSCTIGLSGITSQAVAATALTKLRDRWSTHLRGGQPAALTLTEIRSKANAGGVIANPFLAVGLAGTGGAAVIDAGQAVFIKKVSANAGRAFSGRWWWPVAVASGSVDQGGVIASATVTALQAAFTAYLAGLVADGFPPVILHPSAAAPTVITGLTVDSKVGTQRRRIRA